jgi:hypothetical protein
MKALTPLCCVLSIHRIPSYRFVKRGAEIRRAYAISEVVMNECDVETSLPSKVFEETSSFVIGEMPPHLREVCSSQKKIMCR